MCKSECGEQDCSIPSWVSGHTLKACEAPTSLKLSRCQFGECMEGKLDSEFHTREAGYR